GVAVFAQKKLILVGPGVCAVEADIDGSIADNFYAAIGGLLPDPAPLVEEQELDKFLVIDIGGEVFAGVVEGFDVSGFKRFGPFNPALVIVVFLESFEQCIITKPASDVGRRAPLLVYISQVSAGACVEVAVGGVEHLV